MNPWTGHKRPAKAPNPVIILAVGQADAAAYATRHGETRYIAITPRNIAQARGRVAEVYATRRARLHARYADMIKVAAPCGETLPRRSRDRRVG